MIFPVMTNYLPVSVMSAGVVGVESTKSWWICPRCIGKSSCDIILVILNSRAAVVDLFDTTNFND